uniref:Uncharacterized protein n=1 Tax=viral metagenome TaxID=1070528 RepID=A0A6C0ASG5_9ZZZZ
MSLNMLYRKVVVIDKNEPEQTKYHGTVVMIDEVEKIAGMPQHGYTRSKYVKFDDIETLLSVLKNNAKGWPIHYNSRSGNHKKGIICSLSGDIVKLIDSNNSFSPNSYEYTYHVKDISCIKITDEAFDVEII